VLIPPIKPDWRYHEKGKMDNCGKCGTPQKTPFLLFPEIVLIIFKHSLYNKVTCTDRQVRLNLSSPFLGSRGVSVE
jgi:hypothetical protein